eukprot:1515055-Prymnesium_polylepis.2
MHTRSTPDAHRSTPDSFGIACWRRRAATWRRCGRTACEWRCSGLDPAVCPRASTRSSAPCSAPPRLR